MRAAVVQRAGLVAERAGLATAARAAMLAGAGVTSWALARAYPSFGHFVPPCPWLALTGTYCPGCGTGRMVINAAEGDVVAAVSYNPLALVAGAWVGWVALSWALAPAGARLPLARASSRAAAVVGTVIVAWWVLRNVPGLGLGPGEPW